MCPVASVSSLRRGRRRRRFTFTFSSSSSSLSLFLSSRPHAQRRVLEASSASVLALHQHGHGAPSDRTRLHRLPRQFNCSYNNYCLRDDAVLLQKDHFVTPVLSSLELKLVFCSVSLCSEREREEEREKE